MQHDEVIWNALSQNFCSYKVKTRTSTFCKNEYNVTGLCSRQACPLANSRYATILEREGRCVLYIKTIERAHMPKTMWEKIKLPTNYAKALEVVDQHMQYWPKFLVHKAKQRLTKITQYLIRMRRLKLKQKTRLVGINKKAEKRDKSREKKALAAAKLDRSIEKELLDRLRSGTYDNIYNFPQLQYEKALEEEGAVADEEDEEEVEGEEEEGEEEYEAEYEDDYEDDEEEEAASTGAVDIEDMGSQQKDQYDFADDLDGSVDGNEGEVKKALSKHFKSRKRKKRGGVQVEVEYEPEMEEAQGTSGEPRPQRAR